MRTRIGPLATALGILFLALAAMRTVDAGEVNPTGAWTGVYWGNDDPSDTYPMRATVTRKGSGGGLEVAMAFPEDGVGGLRAVDSSANLVRNVCSASGVAHFSHPNGVTMNVKVDIAGMVNGDEWKGILTTVNADDEAMQLVSGGFALRRQAGSAAMPQRGERTDTPRQTRNVDTSRDPNLDRERAVWLKDPVNNMYFGAVLVPPGWQADGRVQWNYVYRSNPKMICINLVNPSRRISAELALGVGAFTWSNDKAKMGIRDGEFMTDTGIMNLQYRDARTVLSALLGPAIRERLGGEILYVRDDPGGGDGAAQMARSEAAVLQRAGRPVSGAEGNGAEMAIAYTDRDGTRMRATVVTSVSAVGLDILGGTVTWTINGLSIVTAPENADFTLDELDSIVKEFRINPEWERLTNARLAEIAAGGMESAKRSQEEISRRIRKTTETHHMLGEKFRRALSQESVYMDPGSGESYLVPNDAKYAVINPLDRTIIRSERELNPNAFIGPYREMLLVED